MKHRRHTVTLTGAVLLLGVLTACGSSDDLEGDAASDSDAIVVGSQDYYSNEIIAEIYAQALEADGHQVQRDFRIGQREVYVSEIENGSVDVFPEYTGPLLQYWKADTPARQTDEVYNALVEAAPDGVAVLDQSSATDQDAYVVTREFADEYGVTSIEDLRNVPEPLTLGGNSEGEDRPNGPRGLEAVYGVEVGFTPIEDGGGPLTVKALADGDIDLAIIYTADPSISQNDLVVLDDPQGLFLASHVVPVVSDSIETGAQGTLDEVSAALTPAGLLALNEQSVTTQAPAASIAEEWLARHDLG